MGGFVFLLVTQKMFEYLILNTFTTLQYNNSSMKVFGTKNNKYFANMMSKIQSNNENHVQFGAHFTKNNESSRKHPLKKVFGEIKNVIHNQGLPTPLKPDNVLNKTISSKSLQHNIIRSKHQPKQSVTIELNKIKLCKSPSTVSASQQEEIDSLDYFDFRGGCCSKPCKSDEQIWSEMNEFDDSFIDKIILDDVSTPGNKPKCDVSIFKDNDSDADILKEFDYNYWPGTHDIINSDTCLFIEKPCSLDFEY